MELVRPRAEHLPSYVAALQRGWSADNTRPEAGREQLARIEQDADAFLACLHDPDAQGAPVTLPAGSSVPRGHATAALRRMLHERFVKPAQFGAKPGLRYRIAL